MGPCGRLNNDPEILGVIFGVPFGVEMARRVYYWGMLGGVGWGIK